MSKKLSVSGQIYLYDMYSEFVTSKKYRSISDRLVIIDKWKKIYRLEDKKYILVINPDINLES
jgi:hypothetical protein